MHKLGIIIATKDRPDDLRKMLTSVRAQTHKPEQVVIVDSSVEPVEQVAKAFEELNVTYRRHHPPSAAAQRNAGLRELHPEITLVAFMDDDIILDHHSLERMLTFWEQEGSRLGGAAFNWLNANPRSLPWLKSSPLVDKLGLYSRRRGGVAPSGWQTVVDEVDETVRVEWLCSGASVWRREIFDRITFDPFFEGYSYLEDLDFSYSVGREYGLAIVADAGFRHYPGKGGRITQFHFGRIEVRNRLYFVRKHGLSRTRCVAGLAIRFGMSLFGGLVKADVQSLTRAGGNIVEMGKEISQLARRTSSFGHQPAG